MIFLFKITTMILYIGMEIIWSISSKTDVILYAIDEFASGVINFGHHPHATEIKRFSLFMFDDLIISFIQMFFNPRDCSLKIQLIEICKSKDYDWGVVQIFLSLGAFISNKGLKSIILFLSELLCAYIALITPNWANCIF